MMMTVQAPFLVEGFEDHMCDSDKSENFRRLYECTDRQRDGAAAWTRAECAAPDAAARPGWRFCARLGPDETAASCSFDA